jgi:hypothetical protein
MSDLPSRLLTKSEEDLVAMVRNEAVRNMLLMAGVVDSAAAQTPLERAWLKSIGRVPGCLPPPGWRPPPPAKPMAEPQGGYAGRPARRYSRSWS